MRAIPLYDVIIAGAGPVGLLLACELRLAKLSVLMLEQAEDPHSPLKQPPFGIRGLSIPTLEALHRRGLFDAATAPHPGGDDAPPPHWAQQAHRPGGHFAGIQFFHDKIDAARWSYRLPGPIRESMPSTMERVESALAARAAELGVEIRRGLRVTELAQSEDGVYVQAGGELVHGLWLVGCDGGRSAVRKATGFEFVGTEPEFTGYSVDLDLELADGAALTPGRHYTQAGMYTFQPPGIIAMVDFDGGVFHGTGPISAEHVQAVLRRVSGTKVRATALRLATTWTDRARQATRYRNGRVLLAGDAAHIHSPFGGQGLNLGIGDAMNLGWKLAATVRGDAPEGLLDSYTAERRPIGAQVLDWSRAQVALMRPSPATRALADIVRDLIDTPDGATYFAERVWGATPRYDLGESHPLVGRSAPDFVLDDGTTLADHLQTCRGLLLDFDTTAPLRHLVKGWEGRITYVASGATDALGLRALLVRPDGIVAWVDQAGMKDAQIAQAAQRWFGVPTQDH